MKNGRASVLRMHIFKAPSAPECTKIPAPARVRARTLKVCPFLVQFKAISHLSCQHFILSSDVRRRVTPCIKNFDQTATLGPENKRNLYKPNQRHWKETFIFSRPLGPRRPIQPLRPRQPRRPDRPGNPGTNANTCS